MIKYVLPVLFFISNFTFGQNYQIKVDLKSAANKEVFLANYYISNIYLKDTIQLDNNGTGVFKSDSLLPQGLYKIYLDDKNHFDFILGADQEFTLSNKSFSAQTAVVNGAVETEEFLKYVVFLKGLQTKSAEIREKLKTATEGEKKNLNDEMAKLNPLLHSYWENIGNKYPNTFLAKFLMSNNTPALNISTVSQEVRNNDSLLLLARFNYQKEHYWDNFDYTDERFLYTPLLKPKLETWFTKVLHQDYDRIKPEVFEFIENVRPQKRIFQFVTSWFLNSSINSNIMGMDALFVDLAKKYYLSGDAFWATPKSIEKIKENLLFAESNLIGKTAPDLTLESVDGEYFNLHQIDAKYTALLIYEPDCSHCKIFVPEFHKEVYQKFKDKGLKVFAIYSMDNKKLWVEFLTKHNMYDWINVWDEHHVSRFKILYDARKTPGIYILDENKKIVAKKMTVEQAKKLMESELN
ncbi:MAG: redoxin domain-containing protein [Prolixibacteraceae bacterium]|jgi:peroxiredoxin|nr:redoxin domain-containing protein [Prolixibacteraceae bacterium]MBT6765433.1 redoxin domain-containing protein [Prolixibacteraceae bacterium]MBT6997852.1 redoxin domain-containing protein [Prolixibacteraceae bacterium]MBT7394433.1 redoxin domain-containing protein [Prolixibacteraceae bacterium]